MPMGGPGHMSRWIAMWTIFFRWHCPVSKSGSPSSRRVFEVPSIDVEGIFGTKNKRRIYVLEKQVAEKDQMRLRILKKAFSVIDNANNGFINKKQCILLFEELNKYRTIPEIPTDDFEFVFNKLDVTCDSKINLDEFARLCNVIALKFEEKDSLSIFEKCPKFYHFTGIKEVERLHPKAYI